MTHPQQIRTKIAKNEKRMLHVTNKKNKNNT